MSLTLTGGLLADGGKGTKKGKKGTTITIPGPAVFPEGIATKGGYVSTDSAQDGTIYRAPRRGTEAVAISLAGLDGRTAAIGMKFDRC